MCVCVCVCGVCAFLLGTETAGLGEQRAAQGKGEREGQSQGRQEEVRNGMWREKVTQIFMYVFFWWVFFRNVKECSWQSFWESTVMKGTTRDTTSVFVLVFVSGTCSVSVIIPQYVHVDVDVSS